MSTNFHIDDIGNLILRDGTLGLCVSSQNATPPYGGGRVGALSPYVYCADNPVNCVDLDGNELKDALIGFLIGLKTNMPLGNGEDGRSKRTLSLMGKMSHMEMEVER